MTLPESAALQAISPAHGLLVGHASPKWRPLPRSPGSPAKKHPSRLARAGSELSGSSSMPSLGDSPARPRAATSPGRLASGDEGLSPTNSSGASPGRNGWKAVEKSPGAMTRAVSAASSGNSPGARPPQLARSSSVLGAAAAMLEADQLHRLPVAEALRQVLIQTAGSLQKAYEMMDVQGFGLVDFYCFRWGLEKLSIVNSPLKHIHGLENLYWQVVEHLNVEHPEDEKVDYIDLSELLGYVSFEECYLSRKDADVARGWAYYCSRTAGVPSMLARDPLWRMDGPSSTGGGPRVPRRNALSVRSQGNECLQEPREPAPGICEELAASRRKLRQRLREARGTGLATQRAMVGGLVSAQEHSAVIARDRQRNNKWNRRIEGHIRECSKARHELVEVQRKLEAVSREGDDSEAEEEMLNRQSKVRKSTRQLSGTYSS
eukprot:TRINITY_DN31749_c0_g1_i1.p1 TRINITY_DN31749_c0_g1~~TRINITY_DN31749_c0_g1_i1.p1  ORF type:complete len:434 (-),score=82.06 TRINITY_DN31749_c0_g1_i1:261-1562(-)